MKQLITLLTSPKPNAKNTTMIAMLRKLPLSELEQQVISFAKIYLDPRNAHSIIPLIKNNLKPNARYIEEMIKNQDLITLVRNSTSQWKNRIITLIDPASEDFKARAISYSEKLQRHNHLLNPLNAILRPINRFMEEEEKKEEHI